MKGALRVGIVDHRHGLASASGRAADPAAGRPAARMHRLRVLPSLEALLFTTLALVPAVADHYAVAFVTRIVILGLLALSFDLAWGYAGILTFGQALFFGTSGYVVALVVTKLAITSAWILLPLAAVTGLAVAMLMALLVLFGKRAPTQVFVALGTLTGSYVADRVARGWSFVGGQNGIPSVSSATAFGVEIAEGPVFYYVALVLLVLVYVFLRWLVRSQLGLVLAGIRQQEDRVNFLGYNTQNYKGVTFCISGAVAGLAGGLYVLHEGFVGPGQLGPVLSTQVVVYAMFGGVGTLIGAVLGTALVEVVGFFASQQWEMGWPIVLSLMLLAVVTWRPTGLIGLLVPERDRIGRFGSRRKQAEGDA